MGHFSYKTLNVCFLLAIRLKLDDTWLLFPAMRRGMGGECDLESAESGRLKVKKYAGEDKQL